MNDVHYPAWLSINQSLVALRYCLELVSAWVGYRVFALRWKEQSPWFDI
jgi:hypothetical protein